MINTRNTLNYMLREMCAADSHEVVLTEEYWNKMNCNRK